MDTVIYLVQIIIPGLSDVFSPAVLMSFLVLIPLRPSLSQASWSACPSCATRRWLSGSFSCNRPWRIWGPGSGKLRPKGHLGGYSWNFMDILRKTMKLQMFGENEILKTIKFGFPQKFQTKLVKEMQMGDFYGATEWPSNTMPPTNSATLTITTYYCRTVFFLPPIWQDLC